jgi:hypothetical protein
MTQSFSIYQGDTFLADAVYRTAEGVPIPITPGLISASLKTRDDRHMPIQVILGEAVGTYQLKADTENWPLGRNFLVVRYTSEGIVRTAEMVQVNVEDA